VKDVKTRVKRLLRLPMVKEPERPLTVCTECGKCCTYVSVGVNPPNSVRRVTDMLWYLYHHNVSLYRDGDDEWQVVFETRCKNLQDDLLCGVYEHRPVICRAFDNRTCEINDPEGGLAITTPQELMDYLRERRPRLFKKIEAKFVPPAGFGPVPKAATRG
jgi:Fe-S-cluster containining protein